MYRDIYRQYRASYNTKQDIHTRLMKKYRDIPSWWFHSLLAVSLLLSLALCIFKKDEIQMPWWGLIFAAGLALTFTLPVSVITATTNQASTTIYYSYSIRIRPTMFMFFFFFSHVSRHQD